MGGLTDAEHLLLIESMGELLSDAGSIERLKTILGNLDPGRYTVDEISTEPLPSRHTARRWGVMLRLNDGTIIEERDPWEDRPSSE